MKAFGLRPLEVVRTAQQIARELEREDISRTHLRRLRQKRGSATESKIFIVVAALRELTGHLLTANDVFEVEPAFPGGGNGGSRSVPLFSGLGTRADWRPFVEEDAGSAVPSFETLYTQYGVLLRAIAMREFRVPPDDAEAVVHDAFVVYLQRQTTIREAKGWLIGTVRNGCRHYWRDRKRDAPLESLPGEPVDTAAEGVREAAIWRITVASALAGLGARCRDMLRRYYWKDESTADLAEHFSTSKDNVWQLLSRCRQRVSQALGKRTAKRTTKGTEPK
jgi:RNA polymerase sigma factor (sigma-70 family)